MRKTKNVIQPLGKKFGFVIKTEQKPKSIID